MDAVIQIIQTLGFPIACVIALFYTLQKERDQNRETIEKLTQTIQENTAVIMELKGLWQK